MNNEKMGMSMPKREIDNEIDAGIQEHQGEISEKEKDEISRERKEKLYGSLASIERSRKEFLDRMKDKLPNELKDLTPEILMKLENARLNWYNYDNAFFKDGETNKPRIAQSGVSGSYGIPEDAKDLFVFDHMTYNKRRWGKEAYLYGETDDLKNIPEEYDIVPDWITVEKLKAKVLFLKSQGYKISNEGISKFLSDRHEADNHLSKLNKAHDKKRTEQTGRDFSSAENEYNNKYRPEMTRFFGISEN